MELRYLSGKGGNCLSVCLALVTRWFFITFPLCWALPVPTWKGQLVLPGLWRLRDEQREKEWKQALVPQSRTKAGLKCNWVCIHVWDTLVCLVNYLAFSIGLRESMGNKSMGIPWRAICFLWSPTCVFISSMGIFCSEQSTCSYSLKCPCYNESP